MREFKLFAQMVLIGLLAYILLAANILLFSLIRDTSANLATEVCKHLGCNVPSQ